jgi:prephenate dehydrogenase
MLRSVAVIGAAGRMGRWLCNLLVSEGFKVLANDVDISRLLELKEFIQGVEVHSLERCVRESDIVLLSVPIEALEDVLKGVKPYVKEDHIVIDICSIKKLPVDLMHKYLSRGVKLGSHPLFGPGTRSLKGKKVVLTPTSNEEFRTSLEIIKWLEERGALGIVMDPLEHDLLMTKVMGISQAIGILISMYLSSNDLSSFEVLSTPTYNLMKTYATAILAGNLNLYITLQKYLGVEEELSRFKLLIDEFITAVKEDPNITNKLLRIREEFIKAGVNISKSYEIMYRIYESS